MTDKVDKRDPAPGPMSKKIKAHEETHFRVCDRCRNLVTMRRDYEFASKVVRRFEGTCKLCGNEMRVEKPL